VREDLIEGLVESAGETTIFISSHDLADIESFASHIGYLDDGRLQFSEEMTALRSTSRSLVMSAPGPFR
jgi:ABC-2 type transport system ATP-binding protein